MLEEHLRSQGVMVARLETGVDSHSALRLYVAWVISGALPLPITQMTHFASLWKNRCKKIVFLQT